MTEEKVTSLPVPAMMGTAIHGSTDCITSILP
jgi:hypothetical protein